MKRSCFIIKLTETTERYSLSQSFRGRKNGITFEIDFDYYNSQKWYVMAKISKDTDICYNTLWEGLSFKTIEETTEWCESITQDKLRELRENYFKNRR